MAKNEKFVRQQILKARKYRRTELLLGKRDVHKNKLVFNITHYPIFSKLSSKISRIYLLSTPDGEHSNAFENVPLTSFKKGKSSKNILMRAKVHPVKTE